MRIIVGGYIGLYPTGGATWDYIQYPLGLKLLGHDVYYIEDTMQYPVYQLSDEAWDDCTECVKYLKKEMESIGLEDRWAYRDGVTGNSYGMSQTKIEELCASADVFINVSCSTVLREEYLKIPRRIMVDTDPMFTQVEFLQRPVPPKEKGYSAFDFLNAHTDLYTFGLNIGKDDCRIPDLGFNWKTTKKPICIDFWNKTNTLNSLYGFTSIMNWKERAAFEYEKESWGQKNIIFEKFVELPKKTESSFDLIINRPADDNTKKSMLQLEVQGWNILSPHELISNKDDYNNFIQASYAEFSVTKETYIKSNSGWFSGRSACYLAAGKPVITQDTQWTKYIPAGEGLFACDNLEEASNAVKEITADYSKHSKAAKEIAAEYFDSSKVLSDILKHV